MEWSLESAGNYSLHLIKDSVALKKSQEQILFE
ncbi:hypothetical protein T09_1067 [Trichinella sp. T9]|nr:hypothetical protein T09_1067 [Trichinella sp. T9]